MFRTPQPRRRGERPALAHPKDLHLVWRSSGGQRFVALWEPVPPAGYRALGTVARRTPESPAPEEALCMREDPARPAAVFDWAAWRYEPPVMQVRSRPGPGGLACLHLLPCLLPLFLLCSQVGRQTTSYLAACTCCRCCSCRYRASWVSHMPKRSVCECFKYGRGAHDPLDRMWPDRRPCRISCTCRRPRLSTRRRGSAAFGRWIMRLGHFWRVRSLNRPRSAVAFEPGPQHECRLKQPGNTCGNRI